jgi:hypothetical protein
MDFGPDPHPTFYKKKTDPDPSPEKNADPDPALPDLQHCFKVGLGLKCSNAGKDNDARSRFDKFSLHLLVQNYSRISNVCVRSEVLSY